MCFISLCSDYLFQWKGRGCTKAHMRSLGENMMVETTVIDSWTCILNENEILRADTSPLRLFLTTETTVRILNYLLGINIHKSLSNKAFLLSSIVRSYANGSRRK